MRRVRRSEPSSEGSSLDSWEDDSYEESGGWDLSLPSDALGHQRIAEALAQAPEFLRRSGLPVTIPYLAAELQKRFLGSGKYAVVYALGERKVLKVTLDRDDGYAAASLDGGKKHRGVVRIHRVGKVPLTHGISEALLEGGISPPQDESDEPVITWTPYLYVIVAERVTTQADLERAALANAQAKGPGGFPCRVLNDALIEAVALMMHVQRLPSYLSTGEATRAIKKEQRDLEMSELGEMFFKDLVSAAETLTERGIDFADYHEGNVGVVSRNGDAHLVVIDFGHKSWAGDREAPPIPLLRNPEPATDPWDDFDAYAARLAQARAAFRGRFGHVERLIVSPVEFTGFRPIPPSEQPVDMKPQGIWYGCGLEWVEWLLSNDAPVGDWIYSVEITSAVLRLTTADEVLAFSREYGVGGSNVDWRRVAERWAGIEICPYQWELRYRPETGWYSPWDVASGCIWDERGIRALDLLSRA